MGYQEKTYFDFRGKNKIGIIGDNESGKSTILQAISYAAFGRTRTKREIELINDNADGDMKVEMGVKLPGQKSLVVKRGRTKKNEPILRLQNRKGNPSKLAKYISDNIGLTYEDFIALSYFLQGDINQLMQGNKREYFTRWTSSLANWAQLEDEAKLWLQQLTTKLGYIQDDIDSLGCIVDRLKDLEEKLKTIILEKDFLDEKHSVLEEQVVSLRVDIDVLEVKKDYSQKLKNLNNAISNLKDRIDQIDEEVEDMKIEFGKLKSGVCPILDLECDDLLNDNKKQIEKVKQRYFVLKKEKQGLLKNQGEIKNSIVKIQFDIQRPPNKDLKEKLAGVEVDKKDVKRRLNKATVLLNNIERSIDRAEEALVKISELRQKSKRINVLASRVQFLKFMCSKSGIPQQIIEGELNHIEDKCNWVLERLGYRKRVQFSSYRELAGYEKSCGLCGGTQWHKKMCSNCGKDRAHKRKDEPYISIIDRGVERSFDLESGGAQTLQSFAVRLAYSLFVGSMRGVPLELLLLDEVFAHLDPKNRQQLMNLIVGRLSSEFGLKQVFVVSHHEDIVNAVDHLLKIETVKGKAIARWL